MKKILLLAAVVVAALATVPFWGGCDVNAKICSTLCDVQHYDSDIKAAGCRARCSTDQLSCLAKKGSKSVDDFVEGFKK